MRWTRLHLEDEGCSPRTAKSCGPDAPTLASSFVESSAKRRGQKSPVPEESPKETVKTIRVRECRVIPARPWWTNSRVFYFPREAAGALKHPAFPTPSLGEGSMDNPGVTRRGEVEVCLHSGRHSGAMRSIEPGIHFPRRFAGRWILRCAIAHHSSR
jgi:hypothetical protein